MEQSSRPHSDQHARADGQHLQSNKHHIVAITALIKDQEGRFLIVKRHPREVAFADKWAFPGGKMERGETVMDALRREAREEVGLELEEGKEYLKDFTFIRPDGHNVVGLCFLVHAKGTTVSLNPHDLVDFRWITPDELHGFDHIPGMEEEVGIAYNIVHDARGRQ